VAEAAKKGIEEAGGQATILQVPETLPQDVLNKMYAPPKPDYPIATPADLAQYDGFMFGVSTRFGNWSAQFKSFWDATGQLWATGALHGKFASTFVSSAGPGGGQESTFFSTFTTLAHHGIIFVPLVRVNPLLQSNPLTISIHRATKTHPVSGTPTLMKYTVEVLSDLVSAFWVLNTKRLTKTSRV